ncbi:MAG: NYN domain-containing protein [bacterium]|nr:NYN domain-containing protein [bacterium]
MPKKVFIFIDGGNFYFKLKELMSNTKERHSLLGFNFRKFSDWLVGDNDLVESRYYIGKLSRKRGDLKSELMYANQQKLIGKLQQQNIIINFGQIIKHPDGSRHEKGVDVLLAVEMIRYARQNKYDICYLLSSDTDLVPAVEEVKAIGKEVCYIGIAKGQSFGLTVVANDVRLIRPEEIECFFDEAKII